MAKREPLLVDEFITVARQPGAADRMGLSAEKAIKHVAGRLLEAKRFVLDADASRYIGEMIKAVPDAIAHGQEFAIQPFDLMYVEYDPRPLFAAVTGQPNDPKADHKIGLLYDGGRVWVIGDSPDGSPPALLPISYRLNVPMKLEEERAFVERNEISRLGLDKFFWGSVYGDLDADDRRSFRANHSFRMEFSEEICADHAWLTRATVVMLDECAGDLRNIIAMLMFLNRTSESLVLRHVPAQPSIIRRKPSSMLSHTVISFKLNPMPRILEVFGTGGAWRRRHDVKGHFCHNDRARNSWCVTHDWQEYEPHRWRCMACGGLRWWRRDHKRGHEDKGTVKTTYEVHA